MIATTANASEQPMNMFHQSDSMPLAARLCASSAFCFEPQPATANVTAISGARRARSTVSPDLSRCLPGYPRETA